MKFVFQRKEREVTMCDLMDCKDCRKWHPYNDIQCDEVKELWESLEDVPMNPETECMDAEWNGFPVGTHREEIWKWFEENFNVTIGDLLM